MKKIIFAVILAVGALCTPVMAQSIKEKLTAVKEGLNDPDPIIRLATLEEALNDENGTVRRYAMTQGMESDDADMRAIALLNYFKGRDKFTIEIEPSEEYKATLASLQDDDDKLDEFLRGYNTAALNSYAPSITYHISEFDAATGSFEGFCMHGLTSQSDNYVFTASLSGETLSMQSTCYVSNYRGCAILLKLENSTQLVGEMDTCNPRQTIPLRAILPIG